MAQSTPLTPAQLAQADILAAAHHLALAREALNRAIDRNGEDGSVVLRSYLSQAVRRVTSAIRQTRTAREFNQP